MLGPTFRQPGANRIASLFGALHDLDRGRTRLLVPSARPDPCLGGPNVTWMNLEVRPWFFELQADAFLEMFPFFVPGHQVLSYSP